ncbi:MAG: single-stranded DNA-binding protein [Cyclobacteriaceae bacterium]
MQNLRNSVSLIGRVGKDPETKSFNSGTRVAFSVATTEIFRKNNGEKVEDTQWHNIIIWGKLADIAGRYLRKGSEVAIEGRLTHRVYETKEGKKRYVTEVNANELVMLGGGK